MEAASVFVVDSQPIVLEGFHRALEGQPGLRLVGSTHRLDTALDLVGRLRPDVAVIDHALGARPVFQLLNDLRRSRSGCALVLRVRDMQAPDRRLALECGVRGFLEQTHPVELILDCLRAVATGGIWPAVPDPVLESLPANAMARLTPREREILGLVRGGLKNREIAGRLSITPSTVKVHLMHLFEKTGSRDRQELALRALRLTEGETA